MRIRKNKLGKADYEYLTVIKGKWGMVKIYHEPEYCVQIITSKGSQCYPLTFEQYNNYCNNAEMILHPNKNVLKAQFEKAKTNIIRFAGDPNLKKFWLNVREHYAKRLEHERF